MENLTFNFDNVIQGDGLLVSAMGMVIVFLSLSFISLFIKYLPKMLRVLDKIKERKEKQPEAILPGTAEVLTEDPDLYAAICAVIALEVELSNFGDDQRITLDYASMGRTAWSTVGKMRTLSSRIAS